MEYETSGRSHYTGFALPLVVDTRSIPSPTGYYGLIFLDEGTLTLTAGGQTRFLPAPIAVFSGTTGPFSRVEATGGIARSIVFRTDAINASLPGEPETSSRLDGATLLFLRPFLDIDEAGFACRSLNPSASLAVKTLFDRLKTELVDDQGPYWPCMSRSYFLEILLLLERDRYALERVEGFLVRHPGPLDAILEYLHTRYADAISLDSLAARFATNRTSLNKKFREAVGMSVIAYLTNIRIEVAAALLRNTMLNVREIASRVGFADEAYFSRAFRKRHGLSPLAFRKTFPNPYERSA